MSISPRLWNKGQTSGYGFAKRKVLLAAVAMLLVQCNPDIPRRPRATAPQGQGPSAAQQRQQEEQEERQRQQLEQLRRQLQQQQQPPGTDTSGNPASTTSAGNPSGVPGPQPGTPGGGGPPPGNSVAMTVTPWFITGEKMGWNLSCARISAGGKVLGDSSLCNKRAESGCYSLAQDELGKPKALPSIQSGTKIEVAFQVTRRGLEDCDGPGGTPGFTYDQADTLSVTFGSQSASWRLKCGRKQVGGKYLQKICLEDTTATIGTPAPQVPMDYNDLVLVLESDKPLDFSGTTCSDQSVFSPPEAGRCT